MIILQENKGRGNGLTNSYVYSKDLRIMKKIQDSKNTIKVIPYDEASIYILDESFIKKYCLNINGKCKYVEETDNDYLCGLYGKSNNQKPKDRNCYIGQSLYELY